VPIACETTDDGAKEHDAPEGNPEHEKLTDCPTPLVRNACIIALAGEPCATEPLDGVTESLQKDTAVLTEHNPVDDVANCGFVSAAFA